MASDIKLVGVKNITDNLAKMTKKQRKSGAAGLYAIGNEVMTSAKKQTPVDTGILRKTGYVTLPQDKHGQTFVEIGFGGPAEEYSIPQHERTDYVHEAGNAKFLERPVDKSESTILDILAKFITSGATGLTGGGNRRDPFVPDKAVKSLRKKAEKRKARKGGQIVNPQRGKGGPNPNRKRDR